jgi:putative transposase
LALALGVTLPQFLASIRFRVLNIIDDFNREAVAMEIGTSMPAERVIRIMEKVT